MIHFPRSTPIGMARRSDAHASGFAVLVLVGVHPTPFAVKITLPKFGKIN